KRELVDLEIVVGNHILVPPLPRLSSSKYNTLLTNPKNMFTALRDSQVRDSSHLSQIDESQLGQQYFEFFYDVLSEVERHGTVRALRVARNLTPHLRGNTYVQFSTSSEATAAATALRGRYYATQSLSPELSPVTEW